MRVGIVGGSIGGSIAGLACALALSRRGVDVVLLEADNSSPSDDLGVSLAWDRRGVPQHPQAHAFLSLFVKTIGDVAPEIIEDLLQSGAIRRSPRDLMPAPIAARAHELNGDLSDLVVINARRPFVEAILRRHVLETPGIDFRPAAKVESLTAKRMGGRPHITGVQTERGDTIEMDCVVDATGRQTRVDQWLRALGATPPSFQMESAHQLYFTRHYALTDTKDLPPLNNGFLTVSPFAWGAALMFPGDNQVIQVAMGCLPEDNEMKNIRHNEVFERVVRLAPPLAPLVGSS